MSKLETRAEIIKLARLYEMDEQRLSFLENIPAPDIRVLREAAQDKLFADDRVLFKRLAEASKLLPRRLVAMLAEKVFGALLGARVAGEMDTKRAVALSAKLPIAFLADISLQLDPARARDIIRNIAPERIRAVTEALLERGEFVAMGRFVGYLTEDAIREALEAFKQPRDLLEVGFFIEDKPQLNRIIRLLSDARLRGVINAAQGEDHNLWPEAVALMDDVDAELKRRLGDLTAEQDEAVLTGLCRTAQEQQLWDSVLPVVACMSQTSQAKLLRIPLLAERDILRGILESAQDNQLWPDVLPLVALMDPSQRAITADVATGLATGALEDILAAADRAEVWDSILYLADDMDTAQLAKLGAAASTLTEQQLAHVLITADAQALWPALLPLAGELDAQQKQAIATQVAALPASAHERMVAAAHAADRDQWPALLDIIAGIKRDKRADFERVLADYAQREPKLADTLAGMARERGLDGLIGAGERDDPVAK